MPVGGGRVGAEPRFHLVLRAVGYQQGQPVPQVGPRFTLHPIPFRESDPMSLWTPGGEHPVDRGGEPGAAPGADRPQLSPDQEAEAHQIAAEMAQVREQLAQVPAAVVIANHAMGCYELAAIHLSSQPPNFPEAQLAIDAFAALLDVTEGRLGPDGATLADALAQIRLAYVQVNASWEQSNAPDTPSTPGPTSDD